MNIALLGKWLWTMGNSVQGLWRRIIVDKYKRWGGKGGMFRILIIKLRVFGSPLFVKDGFDWQIRYKVHDGKKIQFWHDEWCGHWTD